MWKKEKKAFKEGKRIQCKNNISKWVDTNHPLFYEYRIHPDDIEPITEWRDNLVVHCKTKEQMEKVIELLTKGESKLDYWDTYNIKTCVRNNGNYGSKTWYKENGYEVITAKEFLKRYKPKKKEIGKEPLKEGEWAAFWDKVCDCYHVHIYHCFDNRYSHHATNHGSNYDFALPISVGHEAILKAMEETNKA